MATSHQLYGPEKRLANIGSYTLKEVNPIPPSVASVDLATFKDFLNSQSRYIKAINSGNVVPNTIIVYVAYISSIYRCRVVLNTGGTGNELLWVSDTDYNTLISTVRSGTGISLNPTFEGTTQSTYIVLEEITYAYNARPVSKFYGPVNGEAELANRVYGPAGSVTVGVTGTIRAGESGNVTDFDGATFWGAAKSLLDSSKTVKYLEVLCLVPGAYSLMINYTDNTHAYLVQQNLSAAQLLAYGIMAVASPASGTSDSIDLTPITSTATKLVHQGFGHLDYS